MFLGRRRESLSSGLGCTRTRTCGLVCLLHASREGGTNDSFVVFGEAFPLLRTFLLCLGGARPDCALLGVLVLQIRFGNALRGGGTNFTITETQPSMLTLKLEDGSTWRKVKWRHA